MNGQKTKTVDTSLPGLEIQRVCDGVEVPSDAFIERCAHAALSDMPDALVNIRIVGEAEGRALNHRWRKRDYATNVLSFPADVPAGSGMRVLGDIVLCGPVVVREASAQGKKTGDHWAHLIIHGILHLRGFDHTCDEQAQIMENREIRLLRSLGIPDPYAFYEN